MDKSGMVTEGELGERVWKLLRSSDRATTIAAAVRRRLEQEFSIDLSDKKAFLRRQVDLFLQSRGEDEADDEAAAMAEDGVAGEGGEEGSVRSEGSGSESIEDEEEEESRSMRIGKKKV